ncbi:hypothetical protein F2Q68_00037069 [Brassica cretica]|uniref:NLE domain-containing protein n=1 Tax=Brassica cretica TaxID=69181 RepID=A0A8S9GZW4_BRACR|nr:hypothetical protein F2Q68_00037069 [Brassica cretica]
MELAMTVMCRLVDAEGIPLGDPMYIPQRAGKLQLTELANKFLNNEEKLRYAFYVSGEELRVPLGTYIEERSVSMEEILTIVYRQEAVFRTRPVSRISASIPGHRDSVLCVSFSPDGTQLASGSGDTTVRLWDLYTQTPMFTCIGHTNWVLSVAWSPDGKHLVSGDLAGNICCWIPKTGKLDGSPLRGHKKWITSISWEPVHLTYPCRRFVTSSKDEDARIWDITLKKSVTCLSGHTRGVTCVKWGGDGIIYTGSQDCTIKIWSPDSRMLLSGSKDSTLKIWDIGLRQLKQDLPGHADEVYAVDWSPDGERVVSGGKDKSLKLWVG